MEDLWTIYTDGACKGNPGPGGWAAILIGGGEYLELGGGEKNTTNNRMELSGAIEALKKLPSGPKAVILTDSTYVMNGITKWIAGWKRNNWVKKDGAPVLNVDLWKALDSLNGRRISWKHVKGHAGDYYNERCDEIAVAFSRSEKISLKKEPLSEVGVHAGSASRPSSHRLSASTPPLVLQQEDRRPSASFVKYYKKIYLFVADNKVYRFDNWPACLAFSTGKSGYPKACASIAEEEDYVQARGLPVKALASAVNVK